MKPLVIIFVFSSKKTSVSIQCRAQGAELRTAEASGSIKTRMYGGPVIGGFVRLTM